jgi:RNA polymerase primary sigma factor
VVNMLQTNTIRSRNVVTTGQQDLIELYFDEVVNVPLLSREEEISLAKRIERGVEARSNIIQGDLNDEQRHQLILDIKDSRAAIEHLITANSRLVISIARKYSSYGVPLIDLIQEGNIGLMRAAKKFDHRRGYKFSTYATWWIRQAVTRAIAMQGRTIRLPVHKEDEVNHLKREQRSLAQRLGRQPTYLELADALEIPPDRVQKTLSEAQHAISLETPVNEEGTVLGDLIADDISLAPEDSAAVNLLKQEILDVLDELPPRERRIICLRFGLEDGECHTFRDVGQIIGVTHERVRQLEASAIKRLRKSGAFSKLRRYLD